MLGLHRGILTSSPTPLFRRGRHGLDCLFRSIFIHRISLLLIDFIDDLHVGCDLTSNAIVGLTLHFALFLQFFTALPHILDSHA